MQCVDCCSIIVRQQPEPDKPGYQLAAERRRAAAELREGAENRLQWPGLSHHSRQPERTAGDAGTHGVHAAGEGSMVQRHLSGLAVNRRFSFTVNQGRFKNFIKKQFE